MTDEFPDPEHDHTVPARVTEDHQPEKQIWVRGPHTIATAELDDGRDIVLTSCGTKIMVDVYGEDGSMDDSAFYRGEELVGEALALLGIEADLADDGA